MLSPLQAVILGALQGLTELFPISSLGHTVIVPQLLGWHIDQMNPLFLSFIVAAHFATALVLFGFFWSDWFAIIAGVLRSLRRPSLARTDAHARLGWLLIIGTIPAGLLGLFFSDRLQALFASPRAAAGFLFCNGLLLLGAEFLRRSKKADPAASDERIARLSLWQACKIGCLQCLALLPGFSRTGSTLAGGLIEGLPHEDAARFAFLLATPIIFAAAAAKVPLLAHAARGEAATILLGALCAAVCAYLSVRFLSRYFKTHTLFPFACYCLLAGACAFFLLG